jgi:hypothetical protein
MEVDAARRPRHLATVTAVRRLVGRHRATSRDGSNVPSKQRVAGSNLPGAPRFMVPDLGFVPLPCQMPSLSFRAPRGQPGRPQRRASEGRGESCRARHPGDRPPTVPAVSRCRARQHHGQAVSLALGAPGAVKICHSDGPERRALSGSAPPGPIGARRTSAGYLLGAVVSVTRTRRVYRATLRS